MTEPGIVCPTCKISVPTDYPLNPLCRLCDADKKRGTRG